MVQNLKVQGYFLVDVDAVALNNSGKNVNSIYENAVATKKITKNGKMFTYVSGQALRNWWRDSLQKNMEWNLSPIERESKIAYTSADPFVYADDDIFGYMKAKKKEKDSSQEKEQTDAKKRAPEPKALTRISPLKNSVLISVAPTKVEDHTSTMARHEGDPVLYSKQEYSAIMKEMFSLDISMVGTFSSYNKTGFLNISENTKKESLERYNCSEVKDPFYPAKTLVQLPRHIRVQRSVETIKALKFISGGAMQTCNMADITPKFIVLASTTTGNHPFSHIASSKDNDKFYNNVILDVNAIKEVIDEYKETFVGKIFIGRRSGFFDEFADDLDSFANEEKYRNIVELTTVNNAIDMYCEQLATQIE